MRPRRLPQVHNFALARMFDDSRTKRRILFICRDLRALSYSRQAPPAGLEPATHGLEGHRLLRIGTTEGIGANLNLLLGRFAEERPNVGVHLHAIHTPAKLRAVRDADLDVAFVRAPADASGLRVGELWSEPLVAVLPAGHALAARASVALRELSSLPLLLGPRSTNPGMHDLLLALCREAGLEPRLGPPLVSVQEALATISTGAAWTLLTAANAPRRMRGVTVRTVSDPAAQIGVDLAWRAAGASPLARTFIDLVLRARDQGELADAADST